MNIEIDGVKYESKMEMYTALNIHSSTINKIKKRLNISEEAAIQLHLKNKTKKENQEKLIHKGVEYSSVTNMLASLNLNRESYDKNIKVHHMCVEDAIKNATPINNKKVNYKGIDYSSPSSLCKKFDLHIHVVNRYAIQKGVSFIEAFKVYVKRKKNGEIKKINQPVVYENIRYKNLISLCRALDIYQSTIIRIRRRLKCSNEAAVAVHLKNIELKAQREEVAYEGKKYSSIDQLLKALGIPSNEYCFYRYHIKLTHEDTIKKLLKEES